MDCWRTWSSKVSKRHPVARPALLQDLIFPKWKLKKISTAQVLIEVFFFNLSKSIKLVLEMIISEIDLAAYK